MSRPDENPTREDYDSSCYTYDESTDTLIHIGDDGSDYTGSGEKIET